MKIHKISASAYKNYESCEFQYALKYCMGFEDISGPSAVLGNICHDVLENLSLDRMGGKIATQDEYNDMWKKHIAHHHEHQPDGFDRIVPGNFKKVKAAIDDLVFKSTYSPLYSLGIPLSAEGYFSIEMIGREFQTYKGTQLKVNGLYDRIDKLDDETLEIVDYKTGKRADFTFSKNKSPDKKTTDDMHDDIQLQIYHLVARQHFPDYKNVLVTLIWPTDGGAYTVPFSKADIPKTINKIEARFRTIKHNSDPQRNRGWWCSKMCQFGRDGSCDNVYNEVKQHGYEFVELKYSILNDQKKEKK